MVETVDKALNFDTGLVGVLQQSSGAERMSLPEAEQILPSEEHLQQRLERLLHQASLEDTMLGALKPDITDRSILQPGPFLRQLDLTTSTVKQALSQSGGSNQVLEQLIELLDEEKDKHLHLAASRASLYQA